MNEDIDKALKFKQDLQKLKMSPVKAADYVSPLDAESILVKGSLPVPETKQIIKGATEVLPEAKQVIKGVTDGINTDGAQKLISGSGFKDKLNAILKSRAAAKAMDAGVDATKGLSRGLKSVPFLGPLIAGGLTYAASGDASAAMQEATPFVNEASAVGPEVGTLEHKLESGTATPAELELLRNRAR